MEASVFLTPAGSPTQKILEKIMRIDSSRTLLLVLFSFIASGLVLATAPSAQAQLILELTSGDDSVLVTDGDAQDGLSSVGEIAFNGSVGDVDASFSVGVSNSPGQAGTGSFLSQTSLVIENTGLAPTSLVVNFSDNSFSGIGPGTLISDLSLSQINSTISNVRFTSFADSTNESFGQQVAATTLQLSGNGGLTSSANFVANSPFSLSSILEIDFAGPGVVTLTGNTTVLATPAQATLASITIPEPTSISLLAALGSLMMVSRRRR